MAKKKSSKVTAFRKRNARPTRGGIMDAGKVVMIQRQFQVIKMRRDGFTVAEIAEAVDCDQSTVRADLQTVLSRALKDTAETTEESRQLQINRLDLLLKTYTPFATEYHCETRLDLLTGLEIIVKVPPNPVYAKLILDIEARRAKLLALDMPEIKKHEVTGIRIYEGVDLSQV